ncbi:MlaA family lipoprotein [Glaciecola sp. 1036]|uniref:MlaA family lipoprotein n=1 Tax=Alteromonadaceae TaxID=72275 RepID=UPI003D05E89B
MKISKILVISAAIFLTACASQQEQQMEEAARNTTPTEASQVSDPFEPFNRAMWDFNYEVLDKYLLKPATQGYIAIAPQPVRTGLLNASENLEEPANTINNLLQGKPGDSASSLGRFLINSTIGVLGIFDVAESMGLEKQEEDFGQVLGVWGIGTGPYLMLPALGPSDVRSLTGRVADSYYWPSTVLEDPIVIGAAVISLLETRASLLEQEENLNRSLDQYLFVRDAYFQRLAYEVSDGAIQQRSEEELQQEEEDFSDFEDMLEGLE